MTTTFGASRCRPSRWLQAMAVVLLIARPAFGLSYSATAIEGVVVDA